MNEHALRCASRWAARWRRHLCSGGAIGRLTDSPAKHILPERETVGDSPTVLNQQCDICLGACDTKRGGEEPKLGFNSCG